MNQRKFFRNDAPSDRSLGIFGERRQPEALFHVRPGDFFEVECAEDKRIEAEDGLTEIDADDHAARTPPVLVNPNVPEPADAVPPTPAGGVSPA